MYIFSHLHYRETYGKFWTSTENFWKHVEKHKELTDETMAKFIIENNNYKGTILSKESMESLLKYQDTFQRGSEYGQIANQTLGTFWFQIVALFEST